MGSQVKLVLVCSSFGFTLSQEFEQKGEFKHLVKCKEGEPPHVTKAVMDVAGAPVLNYWVAAALACSRLSPLKDKVYIVCNSSNYDEIVAWASDPKQSLGGFPVANIFSNGVTGDQRTGGLLDLVAGIKHFNLSNDHLAVAECDFVFEPQFNLQRIIEHAMVRGKDILTFMTPPPGADLVNQVQVSFQDSVQEVSPKVSSVEPTPNLVADGQTSHVVAPLYVFRRTSLPVLEALAGSGPPVWKQLSGAALQGLLASGVAIYGLQVAFFFNVRTLDDYHFTNAFFAHYLRVNRGKVAPLRGVGSNLSFDDDQFGDLQLPKSSLAQPVARDTKLAMAAEKMRVDDSPSDLRATLMEFLPSYQASLTARHANTGRALPERFQKPELMLFKPRKQHPVYTTSNNVYGAKKPQEFDMPGTWSGIQGAFTNTFPGPYKNASLVTATTRSKVHKTLDDF